MGMHNIVLCDKKVHMQLCSLYLHISGMATTTTIHSYTLKICTIQHIICVLQIVSLLLPALVGDDSDIILEVNAGVGGQEAMLFTKEVFQMYMNYASYKGWVVNVVSYDETDVGE